MRRSRQDAPTTGGPPTRRAARRTREAQAALATPGLLDVPPGMLEPLPPVTRLQAESRIDPRSFAPSSTPTKPPRADFTVLHGGAHARGAAPALEFTGARLPSGRVPLRPMGAGAGAGAAADAGAPGGIRFEAAAGGAVATTLPPPPPGVPASLAPLIEELRRPLPIPVAQKPAREKPAAVQAVASVARGGGPDPGIQNARYLWVDLLDGRPPPRPSEGEGSYAVYHTIEVDQNLRITFHTLTSVRRPEQAGGGPDPDRPFGAGALDAAGPEATVLVDERIHVQRRALLEQMDEARAKADQRAHKSQEAMARRLARRRARVANWAPWATPMGFALLRAQAQVGNARIQAVRGVRRGMVEVPDKLISSGLRLQFHVVDRLARRSLLEAIKDPTHMSQEQRSVTLFLTALVSVGVVLLLNSFFALALPSHAETYRSMLTDATLQFVGLIGAPVIIEPLLIAATLGYGPVLAFTAFFIGKMLGAWVLYLMGESLHKSMQKKAKPGKMQDLMEWLRKNTNKYGLPILILDNSVPLAPDQLMLVFAVSGIRFRTWMLGITIGTVIKFTAVIGGAILLGPERVEAFFSNPFGIFG